MERNFIDQLTGLFNLHRDGKRIPSILSWEGDQGFTAAALLQESSFSGSIYLEDSFSAVRSTLLSEIIITTSSFSSFY
jgi:hypothetical protein